MKIYKPDDWHCHLRDGDYLTRTVADEAARFQRAIVMPNLTRPITTVTLASAYRERIVACIPQGATFTPLMTLYLTESTTPAMIHTAADSGMIFGCKLYPAGATTHSQAGVTDLSALNPVFEAMAAVNLPLLIHGESIDPHVDIFDRETVFIEKSLIPLSQRFPNLRIVLEHISTKTAVEFIQSANNNIAATITAHHLLHNRNAIFKNGIRPHYYCLPILKRHEDQNALRKAATSGHPRFFLGTDSAPHTKNSKTSCCGCAGIYTAHAAIELYAEVFEAENALDKLEAFASIHGATFYGLPINQTKITLEKTPWQVPEHLPFGKEALIPLRAGETIHWKIST
jgi:dihydroorotase